MAIFKDGTVFGELPNLSRETLVYHVADPPNFEAIDKVAKKINRDDDIVLDYEWGKITVECNPWLVDRHNPDLPLEKRNEIVRQALYKCHQILEYCNANYPNKNWSFYTLFTGVSYSFNDILRDHDNWRKEQERVRELDEWGVVNRLHRLCPAMYVPPIWAQKDKWPYWKDNMLTVFRRSKALCDEWGKTFAPFISPIRFEDPAHWLEWVEMVRGECDEAIIWNNTTPKPKEWWTGLWQFEMKWALWCQLSSNGTGRGESWGIQNGWNWYRSQHIDPFIEKCAKLDQFDNQVMLHLPFGRTVTERQKVMALDEYLRCLEYGHHYFYESFVEAIKPLTGDREVIAYMGRPMMTTRIRDEIDKSGRADNVLHHIWRSLRLPLEADCSIGWDNMGSEAITDLDAGAYLMTKELTGAWVEATPEIGHRFETEPAIIRWPLFMNRHGDNQHPAAVGRWRKWSDPDFPYPRVMILAAGVEEHKAMAAWFEANQPDARFIPAMTIGYSKQWQPEVAQ